MVRTEAQVEGSESGVWEISEYRALNSKMTTITPGQILK